ncbi:DM9 repeat-containing protein [Methylocystis bryophila]|uniref:DUF3421 domain-containing protein n=1 Tax=Methylocystis bryophila TaxID=655015 RepID=A0A1W6MZL7_9HYPH|nr:DM9 repeat-containing protein [Methylocystis bryophila]ARN83037.1 hypothetical protein B1812_20300 [Methylocystis bryophila]
MKYSTLFALSVSLFMAGGSAAEAWEWTPWGLEHGTTPPPGAFLGGTEQVTGENRTRQLWICQIEDTIGIHPGKVVEGYCNIGYDSKERKYGSYRVLTNVAAAHWVHASNGEVPNGAFEGGREPERTLYVCRGPYNNGVHPGKIVDHACNIPWGGGEPHLSNYEVLIVDR